MKTSHNLAPDEMSVISALVHSPAFNVLKKIVNAEVEQLKELILREERVDVIRQMQGRAVGLSSIIQIPEVLVKIEENAKSRQQKKSHQP